MNTIIHWRCFIVATSPSKTVVNSSYTIPLGMDLFQGSNDLEEAGFNVTSLKFRPVLLKDIMS